MDILQRIVVLIATCVTLSDGFTVHPLTNPTTTEEWDVAEFPYIIEPWPPDYRNDSGPHAKYEHVELSFWNETEGSPGTELCRVVYDYGLLDEDTGNCSLWYDRMLPFEPATTKFSFYDTEYEADRGQYRLLIEYGAPDVSATTMLDVYVLPWAPNISKIPDEPHYSVNDKIQLVCNITNANPSADLEWTLGLYQPISPSYYYKAVDYYDHTSSVIEVDVRREHHGESFICWASSEYRPADRTSSSTSIYVQYPPHISLDPCTEENNHHYYVLEGYGAAFTCQINANPGVTSTSWMKSYDGQMFDTIPDLDLNQTELIEFNLQRNESAVYLCTSVNIEGPGNVPKCTLDVQYGPTASTPESEEVRELENVYIDCTAEANPQPDTYKWKKQGDISFVQEGPRLNISSAEPGDAGVYVCEASNTVTPTGGIHSKMTGSSYTHVHVLFKARRHAFALTKFTGRDGQPAVVRCDVFGYPALSFQWKLNGKPITSDGSRNITHDDRGGVVSVHSVRDEDLGAYECIASNTQGSVNTKLSLLKPGKPDAPQSCTVHNVTDHYTSLLCVPGYDGGESLQTYVEAGSEGGSSRWEVTSSVSWTTGEAPLVVRVGDLEPLTSYTLYIHGHNTHGTSDHYLPLSITTTDGPGAPHPGDTGPSVGLIVGVTMSVLFLLVVLVGLVLLVVWRVGLEPACARTAQEKAQMPYTTLARKELAEEGEGEEGFQNEAFTTELNDSGTARQNEYVLAPGMSRDTSHHHHPRESVSRQEDSINGANMNVSAQDNRANEAYELRKRQSHLAGMGALSHNSNQNLTYTNLPQGPDVRPKNSPRQLKERPPTIGAPAEVDDWELPRQNVVMRNKLGEGAFGEVWQGTAADMAGQRGHTVVAVKVLQANSPVEEKQALTKELALMKTLKAHPNIVQLLGCCSTEEPLLIVLEFAEHGNLQEFLQENRADETYSSLGNVSETLTASDLSTFALQVASGMEYISSLNYLHRDLAARNVLLGSEMVCKICDFGLARDIINNRQYESKSQRRLPIRWMAPESLFDSIYTTKSDVWSFGVLLWEIVTLGSTPYPGMNGPEIMDLLRKGYRMDRPRHCSRTMYDMMRHCWQHHGNQRPTFQELSRKLTNILQDFTQNPRNNIAVDSMHGNLFRILKNPPGEKC